MSTQNRIWSVRGKSLGMEDTVIHRESMVLKGLAFLRILVRFLDRFDSSVDLFDIAFDFLLN